jgi:hypothetical protein
LPVAKKLTYTEADAAFRHALYHFIVTRGHVSKIGELSAALSRSQKTVRSSLQRLADLLVIVRTLDWKEVFIKGNVEFRGKDLVRVKRVVVPKRLTCAPCATQLAGDVL